MIIKNILHKFVQYAIDAHATLDQLKGRSYFQTLPFRQQQSKGLQSDAGKGCGMRPQCFLRARFCTACALATAVLEPSIIPCTMSPAHHTDTSQPGALKPTCFRVITLLNLYNSVLALHHGCNSLTPHYHAHPALKRTLSPYQMAHTNTNANASTAMGSALRFFIVFCC